MRVKHRMKIYGPISGGAEYIAEYIQHESDLKISSELCLNLSDAYVPAPAGLTKSSVQQFETSLSNHGAEFKFDRIDWLFRNINELWGSGNADGIIFSQPMVNVEYAIELALPIYTIKNDQPYYFSYIKEIDMDGIRKIASACIVENFIVYAVKVRSGQPGSFRIDDVQSIIRIFVSGFDAEGFVFTKMR
jgi:hypothetical protein